MNPVKARGPEELLYTASVKDGICCSVALVLKKAEQAVLRGHG